MLFCLPGLLLVCTHLAFVATSVGTNRVDFCRNNQCWSNHLDHYAPMVNTAVLLYAYGVLAHCNGNFLFYLEEYFVI